MQELINCFPYFSATPFSDPLQLLSLPPFFRGESGGVIVVSFFDIAVHSLNFPYAAAEWGINEPAVAVIYLSCITSEKGVTWVSEL